MAIKKSKSKTKSGNSTAPVRKTSSKKPKMRKTPMSEKIKVSDAKKGKISDLEEGLSYVDISPDDILDIDITKVKEAKIKPNVVRGLGEYLIRHSPPGTVVDMLSQIQKSALKEMKKKTPDAFIKAGKNPFDITLRVLFSLGFVPVEIAPSLFQKTASRIKPDFYYIRFDHKNFSKMATDDYTPNLLLFFRQNPEVAVSLGYCLYFPNQDAFLPYASDFRVDITASKMSDDVEDALPSIFKKRIYKFLNTFENWVQKIENLKKTKLTDQEYLEFRKHVTTNFLNPSRINRGKFLWPKNDKQNPFLVNIVFPDNANVFKALVNSVMIFIARRSPNGDVRSVRVPYFSCNLADFYKKEGAITNEDISASKIKLPFIFNRRTIDSLSAVNNYIEKTSFTGVNEDRAVFFEK